MNIERFSVPELLFHPSDIGLEEMGIPEAIGHCVSSLPEGPSLIWVKAISSFLFSLYLRYFYIDKNT